MDLKLIVTTREELKEIITELLFELPQLSAVSENKSKYMTTVEAAAFIKKTPNALRIIVSKGGIHSSRRGNNLLFLEEDLIAWIEKGRIKPLDENPSKYLID